MLYSCIHMATVGVKGWRNYTALAHFKLMHATRQRYAYRPHAGDGNAFLNDDLSVFFAAVLDRPQYDWSIVVCTDKLFTLGRQRPNWLTMTYNQPTNTMHDNQPSQKTMQNLQVVIFFNPFMPTVAIYGYSYKASCVRPGQAIICNLWHPGTLTLYLERQSTRMSKITNDGLTWSDTGCFIAVPLMATVRVKLKI